MNRKLCPLVSVIFALIAGCDNQSTRTGEKQANAPLVERPILKQFATLTAEDFVRHPIWIQSHREDFDKPWRAEIDEETFRPWTGLPPCEPKLEMFLVAAELTLAGGTKLLGFVTPLPRGEQQDLSVMQPYLFAPSGRMYGFWRGALEFTQEQRSDFYVALGKSESEVFPVQHRARPGLTRGQAFGSVPGFCSMKAGGGIIVQR